MKNTLFLSTYYNNPHFIEYQAKSLKQFIEDDFDFMVLDDSEESTKSILSHNPATAEIRSECDKFGVSYMKVPQSIHAYFSDGGYVPDENETTNHPTERHQALIRWLIANHKSFGFHEYKTIVLMDADIFFRKKVNISNYMTADIIGTYRHQSIDLPLDRFPDKRFSDRVKSVNGQRITFYNLCMMFINMSRISNLDTIDVGSWPGTDTGSKTSFFMTDNPQYKYSYLVSYHDPEHRINVFSKDLDDQHNEAYVLPEDQIPKLLNAEIIHYRAGSNWSYEERDYYIFKMKKMFKKYIPDFCPEEVTMDTDLPSKDGLHVLKK